MDINCIYSLTCRIVFPYWKKKNKYWNSNVSFVFSTPKCCMQYTKIMNTWPLMLNIFLAYSCGLGMVLPSLVFPQRHSKPCATNLQPPLPSLSPWSRRERGIGVTKGCGGSQVEIRTITGKSNEIKKHQTVTEKILRKECKRNKWFTHEFLSLTTPDHSLHHPMCPGRDPFSQEETSFPPSPKKVVRKYRITSKC